MEGEIDLREIIGLLWQRKYVIISVAAVAMLISAVFSLYIITPLYEANVSIDSTPYDVFEDRRSDYADYLLQKTEASRVVGNVIESLDISGLQLSTNSIIVERIGNTHMLRVKVTTPDPGVSALVAEQVGLALLEKARDLKLEKYFSEKEFWDKSNLFLEEKIDTLYGDEELRKYVIDNDGNILDLNPVYRRLLQEQGEMLVKLNAVLFEIEDLKKSTSLQPEQWLYGVNVPEQPKNVRWPLNIAAAALIGIFLSGMAVYTHYYFSGGNRKQVQ